MRLVVLSVGKLKDRALRTVADEYLARIRRYVACEEVEVRDPERMGRTIPEGGVVVAVTPEGDDVTSAAFARRIETWARRGKGVVVFLIGGPDGLPPARVRGAHARISLSRLTFPHRLARVVVLEQLYRAMTILRGEPYAR